MMVLQMQMMVLQVQMMVLQVQSGDTSLQVQMMVLQVQMMVLQSGGTAVGASVPRDQIFCSSWKGSLTPARGARSRVRAGNQNHRTRE